MNDFEETPPLVKGGQGRSDDEIAETALAITRLAVVAFSVYGIVSCVTWWVAS